MHGLLEQSPEFAPLMERVVVELRRVEEVFDRQLRSELPPVSQLVSHVERYRGKMLRPVVVLLAGLAAHPKAGAADVAAWTNDHAVVAAVCEMVHMATLVHDDVLDEADTRRRGSTVNRLHGNEAAVILGDYLIASAYHLCSTLPTSRASLRVGRASMVVCSGELLQLHHRGDLSLDLATYFEIIDRKTAELIAAAAELGAASSGADDVTCAKLEAYGRHAGVAFQIQDDLLDLLGEEDVVGKSVGKDLEKGKLTLPVIHHLSKASLETRGQTLLALERAAGGDASARRQVRAALEGTDSLSFTRAAAADRIRQAKEALSSLRPSPARKMLEAMADAVITRAY